MKSLLYSLFGFTPVSGIKIAAEDYELSDDAADPEVMDLLAICNRLA